MPYFVLTVVPSTIGRMSRCTPSRLTSGPWPPSRPATLSISSREMVPDSCPGSTAAPRASSLAPDLLLLSRPHRGERLRHRHAALLRPPLEEAGQHLLDVDVDLFNRSALDDLQRRAGPVAECRLRL